MNLPALPEDGPQAHASDLFNAVYFANLPMPRERQVEVALICGAQRFSEAKITYERRGAAMRESGRYQATFHYAPGIAREILNRRLPGL